MRDAFFASPEFPRLLNADTVKETIARGVSQGLLGYVGKKAGGGYEPFVFGRSLDVGEVEISEDVFIITADEAKKHIEPPKLTKLMISPQEPILKPNARILFQVKGLDQHGRGMTVAGATWGATGGVIGASGVYQAANDVGEFSVTVGVGGLETSTTVTVSKEQDPKPKPDRDEEKSKEIQRLRWSGEVPAQKWVNFYTKVLAKFATGSGLKLTVQFDVAPDGGISQQRLDETKTALRELGLDDEVAT